MARCNDYRGQAGSCSSRVAQPRMEVSSISIRTGSTAQPRVSRGSWQSCTGLSPVTIRHAANLVQAVGVEPTVFTMWVTPLQSAAFAARLTLARLKIMVGVERFELPTLRSQSECATSLRYTPTNYAGAVPPEKDSRSPALQVKHRSARLAPRRVRREDQCLLTSRLAPRAHAHQLRPIRCTTRDRLPIT